MSSFDKSPDWSARETDPSSDDEAYLLISQVTPNKPTTTIIAQAKR